MEKITLSYVGRFSKDKNGNAFMTRPDARNPQGRPYTKLSLKANEYGDSWISGFDGTQTKDWKVGDTVEVEITKKGDYINFSVPKVAPAGMSDETSRKIMSMLETILTEVRMIRGQEKKPMFPEIPEGHTTSSSMPQFHTEEMDQERIAAEEIPW